MAHSLGGLPVSASLYRFLLGHTADGPLDAAPNDSLSGFLSGGEMPSMILRSTVGWPPFARAHLYREDSAHRAAARIRVADDEWRAALNRLQTEMCAVCHSLSLAYRSLRNLADRRGRCCSVLASHLAGPSHYRLF